jgi:hypothetical protein
MAALFIQRWYLAGKRGKCAGQRRRTLSDPDAFTGGTFDHSDWDAILKQHTRPGREIDGIATATIDYTGVAQDARFGAYLRALDVATLESLAPAEQLALLINAYNALCVNLIVQHEKHHPSEPLSSITKIKGVWDLPQALLGRPTSLNEIEHKMLRGCWDEPAIHYCINCASASCPDLRNEAFAASRLREQMRDQAAKLFANRNKGLRWDGRTLTLSRILYWFADDFGGPQQAAEAAIDRLNDAGLAHAIRVTRSSLVLKWEVRWRTGYFPYSWSINRAMPGDEQTERLEATKKLEETMESADRRALAAALKDATSAGVEQGALLRAAQRLAEMPARA